MILNHPAFAWIVAVVLGLGILPSWTALSAAYLLEFPAIAQYTGPFNPLKLGAPLLLAYVVARRKEIPGRIQAIALLWLAAGTGMTWFGSKICPYPVPNFVREWSVMALGSIAALTFLALPRRPASVVLIAWASAVFGSALLDKIAPSTIDWFFANVFDPNTRVNDIQELSQGALTGVFGRQSLAKFLAWLPWLLLFFWPGKKSLPILGAVTIASFASILMTSQRGPFLGAVAGALVFILHQAIRLKNRRLAQLGAIGLTASVVLAVALMPRELWEARIKSFFGSAQETTASQIAQGNVDVRKRMFLFSMDVIRKMPEGNACISYGDFDVRGLRPMHSHNLIVEQFRSRGWAFGAFHLALWVLAFAGAWLTRTLRGSALAAGIATTLILGMFDHPWFVLNHALVLAWLMFAGLWAFFQRKEAEPLLPPQLR